MLIALDYDKTYTLDPDFWEIFIHMAKDAGHEVICVTMRHDYEPVDCSCVSHHTGRKAKRPWCELRGIHVDVWVDDAPQYILTDAA